MWVGMEDSSLDLLAAPEGQRLTAIPAGEPFELGSWQGLYASVQYRGQWGFLPAWRIRPADKDYFSRNLPIVIPTARYSYAQMMADMEKLKAAYPDLVTRSTVGQSGEGRNIPVLRLGDGKAKHQVLLQGAIHAREHMTAWLLMALADHGLSRGLPGDVCWHILPMTNPDGVAVSQSGALGATQLPIYQSDLAQGLTALDSAPSAARWKASAFGTDLNRNFPSGWETVQGPAAPSTQQYKGSAPFSAPEAQALRDYTLRCPFDVTLSYHATGSVIYYAYGKRQPVNRDSESLGRAVSAVTGYPLEGCDSVDGAGYKDWAMDALGIPSLTVEIGCQDAPLGENELYSIFARNQNVLPTLARWLER